jgi:hypothetical protein
MARGDANQRFVGAPEHNETRGKQSKEAIMKGPKKQMPADLTRIALNEQEIRDWRRSFHAEPGQAETGKTKGRSNSTDVERKFRSAAHAAFEKMGED